jgi:biopolymer transport protein ExbB
MDQANIASLASTLPEALSPWTMFLQADMVVKAVMIGLALASVATWTVLVVKTIQLRAALRVARVALGTAVTAHSLANAAGSESAQEGVVGRLLAVAEDEIDKSRGLPADGIKERVAWQFSPPWALWRPLWVCSAPSGAS